MLRVIDPQTLGKERRQRVGAKPGLSREIVGMEQLKE